MKVKVTQSCPTLRLPDLYSPWDSPDHNPGLSSLSLLQGIFPTQGSNPGIEPGLPHCRWILNQLSQERSPRILEWVAYPFSSRSSWPRNQTGVSCIAGRFVTNWAIKFLWKNKRKLHDRPCELVKQATNWERILANHISSKDSYLKYI